MAAFGAVTAAGARAAFGAVTARACVEGVMDQPGGPVAGAGKQYRTAEGVEWLARARARTHAAHTHARTRAARTHAHLRAHVCVCAVTVGVAARRVGAPRVMCVCV